jgi:hypothetical protein
MGGAKRQEISFQGTRSQTNHTGGDRVKHAVKTGVTCPAKDQSLVVFLPQRLAGKCLYSGLSVLVSRRWRATLDVPIW